MIELEQGWRRCDRCRVLVSTNRAEGYTCVDGSSHATRDESWEYMVPAGDPPPGFQPQWRVCKQCASLYYRDLPGICMGTGGPHVPADFDSGPYPQKSEYSYSAAYGEYPDTEPGWRFCSKCAVMWSLDQGAEPCKAGDYHDPSSSLEYRFFRKSSGPAMATTCTECAALVLGSSSRGCVTADGAHSSSGMSTFISFGGRRGDAESGWTQCRNCSCVFLGGPSAGVCRVPADDGTTRAHDGGGSLPYLVTKGKAPVDELAGWRHCAKCALLVYTAQEPVAPCPAGDQHDLAASAKYSTLAFRVLEKDFNGVPGWGRCTKCRSAVFRAVDDGICRDGGVHDLSDGRAYLMADFGGYGFESADWCHRCQALVSVSRDAVGVCHDGGGHDDTFRFSVGVPRDEPPPDPVEAGWRLCNTCRQFVLTDDGTPVGACANGGTHDVTGSAEYTMRYVDPLPLVAPDPGEGTPAQPAAPTRPTITCAESADGVTVAGVLFSADQNLTVTINLPGMPATRKTRTDASGAFTVTFAPVEEAPGNNALVEASDESFVSARARLTAYRPVAG